MSSPLPEPLSRARLNHAAQVLGEVLRFTSPADGVLSRYFRENRSLGQRDRGWIAESVYSVLRRLRLVRRWAGERGTPKELLVAWLAKGEGLSLRQFEPALSATERDRVAALKGQPAPELSLAERCDFPDWLVERLLPGLGEEGLLALSRVLNQPASLDLRVNPMKTDRNAALAQFRAEGLGAAAGLLSPLAIRLKTKPALQKHPLFLAGAIEVQDEGSQLLAYLVAPKRGELVVDFCAGAGGKTLLLGAMMRSTGRLYAFDVSDKRIAKLKPRAARAGLSNVHPVVIDSENDIRVKRLAGKADRVLVDAPCSGLGTLRRNPDLKWRQSPGSVAELTAKQAAILAAAARLVKPGGRLVYATCSLLEEENEAIVAAFLASHPGFAGVSAEEILARQGIALACGERLRLVPGAHDTDGFYAAVLERTA
jgi:16S rRNA (cytosine967-C5)-methyltransferase